MRLSENGMSRNYGIIIVEKTDKKRDFDSITSFEQIKILKYFHKVLILNIIRSFLGF